MTEITTAAELDALHMAVSVSARAACVEDRYSTAWLIVENDNGDLIAWSWPTEDEPDVHNWKYAQALDLPLTVLYRPDEPQRVQPSREEVARALHIFTRRGLGHEYRDIPACIASLTNTGASCLQFTHRAADAVLALLPGRCAPTEDEVLGALFPDGVGFPWIPYERKKAAAVRALYAGQPTVREAKAEALREFADEIAHEASKFPPGTDLTATIIRRAREIADSALGADHA